MDNSFKQNPARYLKNSLPISILAIIFIFLIPDLSGADEPGSGGRLVFGAENEFAGFDVLKARGFAICDAIANNTVQERLFGLDKDDNLVPILGLSALPSSDGKKWTIKLRQGISFHDGAAFNADAVIHHWRRILNPENRYIGRNFLAPIKAVEKIDAFTVQFILNHKWLPFPKVLAEARGLVTFIPSPKAVDADTQNRAPVGTGPFMFKQWQSGDSFIVVKNPNYWQNGKPYLDDIVFKLVPDHQSRYAGLKSGQMDMIWMDRGNIIQKAQKDPSIIHYQAMGNGAEIFILNTTRPPFDNPDVRRALAHAWDQKICVNMSYHNAIPFVTHPLGDAIECSDVQYPEFNIEKAKMLMARIGTPIEIECLHTDTKRGREQGELLQQFGKKAGIAVKTSGLSFGPIIKKVYTKDYQISTWRMPSRIDPGATLYSSFHSKSGGNFTGYDNPVMDALLEAQRTETDQEKREQILCEIVTLINRDVPVIYRGGQGYHILSGSHVKGFADFKNGIAQLSDLWMN